MDNNIEVERFEKRITVIPEDIDLYNHVNNTVYVRWVQEVSSAHWDAKATKIQRETIGWVVVRHEIDYINSALLGDEITGKTWVGVMRRSLCERFAEFHRESDQKVLARSRSLWCPIDLHSFKPVHVGDDVYERFYAMS